jgi:hypothetical protein
MARSTGGSTARPLPVVRAVRRRDRMKMQYYAPLLR